VGLSCSFVELEAKFNASSLLLNARHFNIRRHSWKWCNESSQNSETRALIQTPFARLLVERYKMRHLAAQVRSADGLRGIFKFSEILGSTTYMRQGLLRGSAYSWCSLSSTTTHTRTAPFKRAKTNIQPQPHNVCSTHGPKSPNFTKMKILHLKVCSACRTTRS